MVFLDLDGVIRDWDGGVFKLYNIDYQETFSYPEIRDMIIHQKNISNDDFWNNQGELFWLGLKMYSWAPEILKMLPFNNTYILTSPTLNNAGWSQEWIKINMPKFGHNKQYLIGPAKHCCANPNTLLIDDYEINVDKFRERGGNAILFPQSWNRRRKYRHDRIAHLKQELNKYNLGGKLK